MSDQARLLEKPVKRFTNVPQYPKLLSPQLVNPLPEQAYEELVKVRERWKKEKHEPSFIDLEQIIDAKIIDVLRAQIHSDSKITEEREQQKAMLEAANRYLLNNPKIVSVDISLLTKPDGDWQTAIGKVEGNTYHTYDRDVLFLENIALKAFDNAVDALEEIKKAVSKMRDGKNASEEEKEIVRTQIAEWRNDWQERAKILQGKDKKNAKENAEVLDIFFTLVLEYEPTP